MTKAELIEAWQEATGLCGVLLVRHLLGLVHQADAVLFVLFSPIRKHFVQSSKYSFFDTKPPFCCQNFQFPVFLFFDLYSQILFISHCTSLFLINYRFTGLLSTPTTLIFDFFGNWGVPKIEHTSLRKVK